MKRTLLVALLLLTSNAVAADRPSFNRDIRSILSDTCFQCHGPDEKQRKAGLRLDVREIALKPAESGAAAIVPGKPTDSELVKRLLAKDDSHMPPANSGRLPVWHRPHAQFTFAAVRPVSGAAADSTPRCRLLGKNRGGTAPLLRTCSRPPR